nr:hypothetical protein [Tanacetum cinerariifolium]
MMSKMRKVLVKFLVIDIRFYELSNNSAKELWDAIERHMLGSEYGEEDRKAVVLYEYKTFKATKGEVLLDTYIRYLQVINDLKKSGYKKDNCELNLKFLNNLQPECKTNDVNEEMGRKKKAVVVTSDPVALVAKKTKVSKHREKVVVQLESKGSDDEDIGDLKKITALLAKPTNNNLRTSLASSSANKKPEKAKVKYYNYYKTKMLLAKKDSDEQVLFAEDQAWIESSSDSDQEINANMVFMAKMAKVLLDSEENSSSTEETIAEAKELRPSLYDERVIDLGYTLIFLTHSDEALEIEKFKKARENQIEFAYDYGNLNASYVNEKIKCLDDYFQEIINPDFQMIDSPFQQTSLLKPYVSTVILEKIIIDLEYEVKKKGSSNISSVDLSFVSNSNLNKDVKRYSRKDLLSCNNSHHVDTRSAYACNDAMNVSCNSRLYASYDVNDLFIFDDVSIINSQASKMPLRKKPRDSLNICLWIIDSGCSKHMTGNRALLTNFVEKFLGTVRFGNNDFAVIAGYRDVVIGSMSIMKVYYVEGLPKMKFKKDYLCFACEQGIFIENITSPKLLLLQAKAIARACFTQNCSLIHTRFDKTPYELINKRKPNIKFFHVFGCRCYHLNDYDDVGKLTAKWDIGVFVGYSKKSAAFKVYNKHTRKIHESVNVNFDEISKMACKQFSLEPGLSNLNETRKYSNPTVLQVSETSKKDLEELFHDFYDEYFDASKISKSPTTNVETLTEEISPSEEVFHESFESFQEESSSSIELANVAEALKDADWVSGMQDELDQFARLKRLLNGILKEEVYVGQPPALYGLKQAPRAWYDVLLKFLIDIGFQKELMVKRFEMSMMGEMKFFLGLQVNQFSNGIFINQLKYILDILKRFGMENYDTVPTPIVEQAKLKLDLVGKPVDRTIYRSVIRSLMYLTSSRPDIMFATCMCARYNANPNEHHVSAIKWIFRYLKGTINLGLWYPKDFGFDLTAYSNADHAGCHLDRKTESEYVTVSSCCAQVL